MLICSFEVPRLEGKLPELRFSRELWPAISVSASLGDLGATTSSSQLEEIIQPWDHLKNKRLNLVPALNLRHKLQFIQSVGELDGGLTIVRYGVLVSS